MKVPKWFNGWYRTVWYRTKMVFEEDYEKIAWKAYQKGKRDERNRDITFNIIKNKTKLINIMKEDYLSKIYDPPTGYDKPPPPKAKAKKARKK